MAWRFDYLRFHELRIWVFSTPSLFQFWEIIKFSRTESYPLWLTFLKEFFCAQFVSIKNVYFDFFLIFDQARVSLISETCASNNYVECQNEQWWREEWSKKLVFMLIEEFCFLCWGIIMQEQLIETFHFDAQLLKVGLGVQSFDSKIDHRKWSIVTVGLESLNWVHIERFDQRSGKHLMWTEMKALQG